MKNENNSKSKIDSQTNTNGMVIGIIIIGALIAIPLLVMNLGANKAKNNYLTAYNTAYDTTKNSTYEKYRQAGHDAGYENYHVKNEVDIYVGDIQECSNLEIMKVSDFDYATSNKSENSEKIDSVFEVTVTGTYCVNMQLSEFIIDNKNKIVTVRVPNPALTNFTSKYEMLYFSKNGTILDIFDNGNYREGEDFAIQQLTECKAEIMHSLEYNQENNRNAEESARSVLTNIIKRLNPEIPDLKVYIEFSNTIIV